MKKLSVYVHIPFCKSRCYYCDFVSSTNCTEINYKSYVEHIVKEIDLLDASSQFFNYDLSTIYFGGGTPSLLKPAYFRSILERLRLIWPNFDGELTFEANPNSISESNIIEMKKMGFNRISIGIQTLNEDTLSKVGRIHSCQDAINSIKLCNSYNLNISVDLMLGLPGQSKEDIFDFINTVLKYENVNHISTYMLSVEKGTKLEKLVNDNKLIVLDDDQKVDLFDYANALLKERNFIRYEASNFAKKGFESKHNSRYWELEDYIGLGLSSHSLMNNKRFFNPDSFEEYYSCLDKNKLAYIEEESLDESDMIQEYIMLMFRTSKGIVFDEFYKKFNIDFKEKYKDIIKDNIKYLFLDNNHISIKEEYLNVMNGIILKFI